MSDSRSVSVNLKASVTGYVAGMEKAAASTRALAKTAEKAAKDQERAAQQTVKASEKAARAAEAAAAKHREAQSKIGNGMLITGGIIAVGVGLAVKAFADFDKQMSAVQAVSGANASQMAQLGKAAIKAGADTVFSASEAAKAEAELAKAGVSTSDILGGALTGSLNLASAGGLDLANAATISAQTMNVFGLKGKDVSHIADVLASAANKSAADVAGLGYSLQQGGLVAAQTGLHLEDTVGVLSAFADHALIGADAGTSLKTMLQRLVPQSAQAATAMADIGFNAYDAKGKFVGMASVAQQLKVGLGGLTEKQRASTLATIFGSDAVRGASVLYQEGAAGINSYTKAVNDGGAAQRMASVMLNNLSGDFEQLKGSIDTALIQSGSAGNGVLRTLTQTATGAVNAFGSMPPVLQSGALGVAAVAAAGLLAGGAFLTIVPKIAAAKAAMVELGLAAKLSKANVLAFATGPIGLALAGITVAVGLFAKSQMDATAKSDDLRSSLNQTTGAITDETRVIAAKQLADAGALQSAKDLGIALQTVTNASLGNQPAMASLVAGSKALEGQYNSEMTALVANQAATGRADPQRAATTAALKEQSDKYRHLVEAVLATNGVLNPQIEAQKMVGEASSTAAGKAHLLTGEITAQKDQAKADKQAIDDLKAAVEGFGNVTLDARSTARDYAAALDAGTKALKDNGRTLDTNTEKGRANQAVLEAVRTTALKSITANYTNGASIASVSKQVSDARSRFITLATGMGSSRAAANALATQLGLTTGNVQRLGAAAKAVPKTIKTTASVETADAKAKVADLQAKINAIRGNRALMHTDTADALRRIAALQAQINALRGKDIAVKVDIGFGVGGTRATPIVNGTLSAGSLKMTRMQRAGGGLLDGPGTTTSDSIMGIDSAGRHVADVSTGEYVVNAKATSANLGLLKAINSGVVGLATGGVIKIGMPAPSALGAGMTAGMNSVLGGMDFKKMLASMGGGGGNGGAGVKQWTGVVLQALSMLGQDPSWLNTVLRRMNQESGGRPTAINLTDGNARAGHPSQGLMQTIPGTFAAYAGPLAGRGILDPLANTYAGLNYAMHRYGSLSALNRPGGYKAGGQIPTFDQGGTLRPGLNVVNNRTGADEHLVPKFAGGGFVGADFGRIGSQIPSSSPSREDITAGRLRQAKATTAVHAAEAALYHLRRTKGHTASQISLDEQRLANARGSLRAATRGLSAAERARTAASKPYAAQFHSAATRSNFATTKFLRNIDILRKRGYITLADQLTMAGDDQAYLLAAQAVGSTRTARNLSNDLRASSALAAGLAARQDAITNRAANAEAKRVAAHDARVAAAAKAALPHWALPAMSASSYGARPAPPRLQQIIVRIGETELTNIVSATVDGHTQQLVNGLVYGGH